MLGCGDRQHIRRSGKSNSLPSDAVRPGHNSTTEYYLAEQGLSELSEMCNGKRDQTITSFFSIQPQRYIPLERDYRTEINQIGRLHHVASRKYKYKDSAESIKKREKRDNKTASRHNRRWAIVLKLITKFININMTTWYINQHTS